MTFSAERVEVQDIARMRDIYRHEGCEKDNVMPPLQARLSVASRLPS